ncbi:MAG: SufS family cysteine desulfurase [Fimbriimonadaceae bacterium]
MEPGTLDVSSTRSEFPALHQSVAGSPLTYLDNSATTQRPQSVLDAVNAFYSHDNANVHRGDHQLSQRATEAYENARKTLAAWLNATPQEVVFTKGCTEALNLVAASWGGANLRPGDTVLVSTMEHHSNIVPWQQIAGHTGATVEPIPVSDSIELDLEALKARLAKGDVRAVAVKAVCNVGGTINPVAEVARLAHAHGAVVVVDAAQALAHEQVDVQAWDADFVALTAHKAYGPMGIGALYGKSSLLAAMPPYQTGGGMVRGVSFEKTNFADPPERFEAGTPNVAGAIGFGEAVRFLQKVGVENAARHETCLARRAEELLEEVPGLKVYGKAKHKAGIVSFTLDAAHPHDVGTVLNEYGVAVRTGHHCCMPLMKRLGIAATTRASFACYNNDEDVERLVRAVHKAKELFS